ncbi:MAG: hypothetical protein HY926_05875 [Elusimicrobia bacterium]|nr:hypothetical protein [Elusimicrobiota bacterium]
MNKEDRPATKGDIPNLKADLGAKFNAADAKLDQMVVSLARIRADLREIKATMAAKDDIERVIRHIDSCAAALESARRQPHVPRPL